MPLAQPRQIEFIVGMAIGEAIGFVEEQARRVDMRVENQDVFDQPLIAGILAGTKAREQQYPGVAHGQEYTTLRVLQPGNL